MISIINTLYSLPDITIIPSKSSDISSRKECQPWCIGLNGKSGYLPIITAPMDSVVGEENYQVFQENGISPVLPRTVPIDVRLSKCAEVFCAFGLAEIEEWFLTKTNPMGEDLYLLIDIANGHMKAQMEVGKRLREKYGDRLHLMGGNIANPETVLEYSEAGFDYVRVGIGGGQGCITSTQCGIHYPMASLLNDIYKVMEISRCHNIKIVADGGIRTYSDAIKCLALGADYVMMGYTLSKALESSGKIFLDGQFYPLPNREKAKELFESGHRLFKEYHGMSTKVAQAKILGIDLESNRGALKTSEGKIEMVKIDYTLQGWVDNFKSYICSTMSYTGCRTLREFIGSPECGIISPSTVNLLNK